MTEMLTVFSEEVTSNPAPIPYRRDARFCLEIASQRPRRGPRVVPGSKAMNGGLDGSCAGRVSIAWMDLVDFQKF